MWTLPAAIANAIAGSGSTQWFLDNFNGSAGSVGSAILTDNFTGTSSLGSHTADSGGTWSDWGVSGIFADLSVSGGTVTGITTTYGGSALSSVSHSANGVVIDATITISNSSGTSTLEFYSFVSGAITKALVLNLQLVGGVLTTSGISQIGGVGGGGSGTISGSIADGSYTLRLVAQDGQQRFYWNGSGTPFAVQNIDLSSFGTELSFILSQSGAAGQQFAIDSLVVSNWVDGSLASGHNTPDIGGAYSDDGGGANKLAGYRLDGSGFADVDVAGALALSTTSAPSGSSYYLRMRQKTITTPSTAVNVVYELSTVHAATDNYFVDAHLTWDQSQNKWFANLYVADAAGSTLFDSGQIEVTSLVTLNTFQIFRFDVNASQIWVSLDGTPIVGTDQVSDDVVSAAEWSASSDVDGPLVIDYVEGNDDSGAGGNTAAPSGTFINDTGTDTNGVAVSSHTPEVGYGWFDGGHTDYSGSGMQIQSNAFVPNGSGYKAAFAKSIPLGANYAVEASVVVGPTSGFHSAQLYARTTNAKSTTQYVEGYFVELARDNTSWRLGLYKKDTTTSAGTQIGSLVHPSMSAASTHTLRFELSGSSLTVKLDGATQITATDSTYTSAGSVGCLVWGNAGQKIDSITATYL